MSKIETKLLEEFPRVREDKVLPTILEILDTEPSVEILVFWPSQRAAGESEWPYFRAIEQKLEQLGKTIDKRNREHLFWSRGAGKLHVYPCSGHNLRGFNAKHIFTPTKYTSEEVFHEVIIPLLMVKDVQLYLVDLIPSCQKYGHCPMNSGCEISGHIPSLSDEGHEEKLGYSGI